MIYLFSFTAGYGALSLLGDSLGKFSIARMLETASISQKDLRQDYYHGSSFDIGEFEPTVGGMLGKAPAAITVGLFRPFIWESRNVVMLASGLENLIYLLMSLRVVAGLFSDRKKFVNTLLEHPFLIFLISYSILFSLLVGLSTSNFGALVRFKIPFLPSFVCAILLLNYFLWFRSPVKERKKSGLDKKSLQRVA